MEFFIGTYTSGGSQGIYRAHWRNEVLQITECAKIENPSFLTAQKNTLYAARETNNGSVAAFRVEPDALTPIGEQPILGDAPCHLCVTGERLYVSNYTSGSLTIIDLDADGAFASSPRVIQHEGRSVHARQRAPHVHQSQPTPDGRFLAVCDLGTDAVIFYPLDGDGLHTPGQRVQTPAGAGPRHAAYGGNECWYVLCELSCELLVYTGYGNEAKLVFRFNALRDTDPESTGAALQLSPDGKLLLASVRGANTLVLWNVSPDGILSGDRWFDAHGDSPRDAVFTPDGRHVICACERSDRVTVFALRDGELVFLHAAGVPMPTCISLAEPFINERFMNAAGSI